MKKLSKDAKLMLVDLFFHICIIAIPLILVFSEGVSFKSDTGYGPLIMFLQTMGIYCFYTAVFALCCFFKRGNLLKIFVPRIFISSIIGLTLVLPIVTFFVTIPHVIIMIIGYIIKLIKKICIQKRYNGFYLYNSFIFNNCVPELYFYGKQIDTVVYDAYSKPYRLTSRNPLLYCIKEN